MKFILKLFFEIVNYLIMTNYLNRKITNRLFILNFILEDNM